MFDFCFAFVFVFFWVFLLFLRCLSSEQVKDELCYLLNFPASCGGGGNRGSVCFGGVGGRICNLHLAFWALMVVVVVGGIWEKKEPNGKIRLVFFYF